MVDTPQGDAVRPTYRGDVLLNAVPSEAPVAAASSRSGAVSVLTSTPASTKSRC